MVQKSLPLQQKTVQTRSDWPNKLYQIKYLNNELFQMNQIRYIDRASKCRQKLIL